MLTILILAIFNISQSKDLDYEKLKTKVGEYKSKIERRNDGFELGLQQNEIDELALFIVFSSSIVDEPGKSLILNFINYVDKTVGGMAVSEWVMFPDELNKLINYAAGPKNEGCRDVDISDLVFFPRSRKLESICFISINKIKNNGEP